MQLRNGDSSADGAHAWYCGMANNVGLKQCAVQQHTCACMFVGRFVCKNDPEMILLLYSIDY
jgi:hypothetical protein